MYTWVHTHKAIAQKLLQFENRQQELIQILKDAGETILNDIDYDGNRIELNEIDPFSFFCYIYKYGSKKRMEQLRKIAAAFGISPLPEDERGIPSSNAQKVWLFPYKKDRNSNEIERLWAFFNAAMNDQLSSEQFDDILKINSTGKTKITEGLFYINPEKYLPINAQSRPYLEEVMGIDPRFKSWQEYLKILQRVRAQTEEPFYKISYDAWVWNTSRPSPEPGSDVQPDAIKQSEKDLFPVQEFMLLETLSDIHNLPATEHFYHKLDELINRTGITPAQVHGSIRSDKRIPITLGRRYVLMLKRKGETLIWGMILKAEDEDLASTHPNFDSAGFFTDKDGGKSFIWTEFIFPVNQADTDFGELWEKWLEASTDYYNEIKETRLVHTFKRFTNEAVIRSLFDKKYRQIILEKAKAYSGYAMQQKIIEKYKAILKVNGIEEEKYKWEILGKPIWDLEDPDLTAMIKKIPFKNLVYPMGIAVLIHLSETNSDELRTVLRKLFHSTDSLTDKVKTFRYEVDALYQKIETTLASHQDERTAASYLAFYDPEKYPLYKNSFYSKYCKLLGKRQASTNEKYQHYNELINELITNHIQKDDELLNLYDQLKLPDGFQDSNLLLLAQDMLYRTLDGRFEELTKVKSDEYRPSPDELDEEGVTIFKEPEEIKPEEQDDEPVGAQNFWWLNANPAMWSISTLEEKEKQTYTARNQRGNKRRIYKHFQSVQKGDLMIGYETSPVKQIKAIFEISRGLQVSKTQGEVIEFEMLEKFNVPIDWNDLQNNPALTECEVFKNNQGSLFRLSEEEFDVIRELIDEKNIAVTVTDLSKIPFYKYEQDPDKPFIPSEEFQQAVELLKRKKNIILQGPPGVGKTFIARKLAYEIMGQKNDTNIEMVQFHQSFSYEDFIQGLRPGKSGFELKNGMFYSFCKKAHAHPSRQFFFVIDEINRGNLSKIFGEVMMLIEPDKRHEKYALKLTYAEDEHDRFYIPENIFVIGTMNTADRSLAIVDYALRRRFAFITLMPNFGRAFQSFLSIRKVSENLLSHILKAIDRVNHEIQKDMNLGAGFQIGHSYFCSYPGSIDERVWYNDVIIFEIKPLLQEIWFDDPGKVDILLKELLY